MLPSSVVPALLCAGVLACKSPPAPSPVPSEETRAGTGTLDDTSWLVTPGHYRATVRWTDFGVPHIFADDLASAMFGQGYALARAHVCVFADQLLRIRGERSRYHGAGPGGRYVDTDFGYRVLDLPGRAKAAWPSLSAEARTVFRSWADGFNRYVKDPKTRLPAPCRGAPWVVPVTPLDVVAYNMDLGVIGTSGYFVRGIGVAVPGKKGAELGPLAPRVSPGSNGWGIGSERSFGSRGMLVANPHYPWEGAHTFFESHVVVPGHLNLYGASLVGSPLVNIGFNEHVAWTHTVSNSRRILLYRLALKPGDPTKYIVAGKEHALEGREFAVKVRAKGDGVETRTRTLYRSKHGPIVVRGAIGWDDKQAFALRDVALGINTAADQYFAMGRATDLVSFRRAFEEHHATPFVNTMYADRDGNAFYVDGSAAPMLSSAGTVTWSVARKTIPAVERAWRSKVIAVDGAKEIFDVATDPRARHPGIRPFADAPQLVRRDYVANANESYWATNSNELMTGFHPFYGDILEQRSSRTRMNLALLNETGVGTASGADGKFTLDELEAAILSNRSMTAELYRKDVVALCREDRALSPFCDALDQWDGRVDASSRGAALWREFFAALSPRARRLYRIPFDVARPGSTPRGISKAASESVRRALQSAATRLVAAGIDPAKDALGKAQFTQRGGRRFPVHGGKPEDGTTNIAQYRPGRSWGTFPELAGGEFVHQQTGLTKKGYPVNYGTSFLMALEFTEAGPRARGIMTYSGSSDPSSPHFADQTELWSKKKLRTFRYTEDDISQHQVEELVLEGRPSPAP